MHSNEPVHGLEAPVSGARTAGAFARPTLTAGELREPPQPEKTPEVESFRDPRPT